jgi:chromosome segregation ATPase
MSDFDEIQQKIQEKIKESAQARNEIEEAIQKSKELCQHCGESNKNNPTCVTCGYSVCLSASTQQHPDTQDRLCDRCLENSLLSYLSADQAKFEEIRTQIYNTMLEKESLTKELYSITEDCAQKKIALKKTDENDEILLEALRNAEKDANEKLKRLEKSNIEKKNQLSNIKGNIEQTKDKIQKKQNKIENLAEDLKENTEDRNKIASELKELKDFIRQHVPIRLIKKFVCPPCYRKALNEYNELFRPKIAGTEIRQPVEPKLSNGMCSRCILI